MSDYHFGTDYDMWLYPPVPWREPDGDFDPPESIEAANIEDTLLINAEEVEQMRRLLSENAKLWELARLLLYGATHDAEPAEGLVWSQKVNVLVRELGIEVGDGTK